MLNRRALLALTAGHLVHVRRERAKGHNIIARRMDLHQLEANRLASGLPNQRFSQNILSLRFPADDDLAVLQSLMSKPSFNNLQYVDFRVENRAFYK